MAFRRGARRGGSVAAMSALMLACGPLALPGCTNRTYAGIPLHPGGADEELRGLALLASAGDKQAQLELGIRFEEGRGVAVDLDRAERLYRRAATPRAGTVFVHSPGGAPGVGQTYGVYRGPDAEGLTLARARLERLVGRRSEDRR